MYQISWRNVFQIFSNFWLDVRKWRFLMYILTYFHQKPGCGATLSNLPILLSFTAVYLRVREVLPGCSLQSSVARVRIPISFRSRAMQSAEVGGFPVGPALSLFLSWLLAPHHSVQIPEKKQSITQLANTGVDEFRPCESQVKNWTDPGTLELSWAPVQLGLRDRSNRFCLGFVPGSNLSGIQV
jgi:hypothetical protein